LRGKLPTFWTPDPIWEGEDCYVIGGGPSLRGFDWGLLRGQNTIGCNSAFLLGSHVCKIVIFGDFIWWEKIGRDCLQEYGGLVVSILPPSSSQAVSEIPWVLSMDRNGGEVSRDKLCWADNVGAAALNLALILGARRVFLLGFDMQLGPKDEKTGRDPGRANWHDCRCEPARAEAYPRFLRGFPRVADSIRRVFPGREIYNVTDGSSKLDVFPKITLGSTPIGED